METSTYPHIEFDAKGVPLVKGTMVKVIEVAMDSFGHGWSAQEIHEQHPDLSLAQIHGALTYYYDHKEELDADIERRMRRADEIRKEWEAKPEYQRLRKKLDEARQKQ
jgi:uncharacterized protein (DUF433 family)